MTLWLLSVAAHAQASPDPCARTAHNPAATAEDIQNRAQRLRELTQLLSSADFSVRLATLDAMLNACDQAVRELGYEAGFASADQALRALTLKRKILSAGQILVDLLPPESPSKAQEAILQRGARRVVPIGVTNPATGAFGVSRRVVGNVTGLELQVTLSGEILRARLEEGAVLTGTLTRDVTSIPVRIILR